MAIENDSDKNGFVERNSPSNRRKLKLADVASGLDKKIFPNEFDRQNVEFVRRLLEMCAQDGNDPDFRNIMDYLSDEGMQPIRNYSATSFATSVMHYLRSSAEVNLGNSFQITPSDTDVDYDCKLLQDIFYPNRTEILDGYRQGVQLGTIKVLGLLEGPVPLLAYTKSVLKDDAFEGMERDNGNRFRLPTQFQGIFTDFSYPISERQPDITIAVERI